MILSDRDIRDRAGELFPGQKLEDWQFQPASVDLLLGPELLEVMQQQSMQVHSGILPGALYLGSTLEKVAIPKDLVGRVEGKSSLARKGLSVHLTAGFIDPGFQGQITLEFTSVRYLQIHTGQPIAQICFYKLSSDCLRPYGSPGLRSKYQGQMGPAESRLK